MLKFLENLQMDVNQGAVQAKVVYTREVRFWLLNLGLVLRYDASARLAIVYRRF